MVTKEKEIKIQLKIEIVNIPWLIIIQHTRHYQ